ncbi:hypothetical protein K2173_000105 [Erythroxylum novogranatense]|uniref:non-specific serine/threonine protein kinase n=1 Tax=Erythroxylum novogranatense TaxID=1862640 RepID=A0AAV8SNK6_9ROSI|nr:hypothetical protein K2173_000105 [Erythroxylum novogranatense]
MYKTRIGGCVNEATAQLGYVDTDPSGRYGRFREILGKGAMKTVYRAFDEVLGMEVAWNQVKLNDMFRSPEELQRLYSEVHLLKSLNHESIMKFYTYWVDIDRRTFNFITEMFTSGTLRQYRQKYPRIDIRAVKNWAQQILRGLAYLHSRDPPVIHRDLKCDNIFINGHLGQVRIGDLGLAAVLRGSQHAHSVIGTPEFMAPELYEEEYDELVDIYSFGMCVLEMLTSEYPYSECSNPAQIYKKVTARKLPEAFYRIEDSAAQEFVGKCLETVSKRLSAKKLLMHPFLASDEAELLPILKVPIQSKIPDETLEDTVPESTKTTDMTIKGTRNPEDDTVFLRLQISDKKGHTRNIHFPFDILNDTTIDVAMEMVKELEISDWEPVEIAEMIEEEISSLIPTWKDWGFNQIHHQQHSYSYEDEELSYNKTPNPLHSNSSLSSSQASLFGKDITSIDGELFMNDDTSSESSMNSYNYSTLHYCSVNEDDYETSPGEEHPTLSTANICHSSTRFCQSKKQGQEQESSRICGSSPKPVQRKLSRIGSFMDIRTQLLQRSLMDMIHKRRLFKTVGAVENIGFHESGFPHFK